MQRLYKQYYYSVHLVVRLHLPCSALSSSKLGWEVLTWDGDDVWSVSHCQWGRTSELLVSFVCFGLGGILLFGLFLFFPTTGFWFPAGGSFRGAFGLAVQCGGLWGVTCLHRFFGGSIFFILKRGGIMFAVTDSPPQPLLDHVLLCMRNYSC